MSPRPMGPSSSCFGEILGERGGRRDAAQDVEQHGDGGLLGERQILAAHPHRHARGDQGAAQRAQHARGRADDDGHPRPGQAVEMRAPQRSRDERGLLARGAEQPDAHARRRVDVGGHELPVRAPAGKAGGHPAGRLEQAGPAATGHGQRHRRHLAAAAETRVDVADRGLVRTAERVDRLVRVADEDQLVRNRRRAARSARPARDRCPDTRRRRCACAANARPLAGRDRRRTR